MQIGLDRIHLSFPLDLTVKGIEVVTTPADTLLTLQSLSVRVNPLPLFRKIISVESLRLQEANVNTGTFIEGMDIIGTIRELSASADYINLTDEKATLNALDLSDATITLRIDSVSQKEDTTSTPVNWKFNIGDIDLNKVSFAMQMPADSLRLSAYIDKAKAGNGLVDLGISRYTVKEFNLSNSIFNYDTNDDEPVAGLDPAHLALNNLNADIRSIVYQDKDIQADIRSLSVEERSGLIISSLEGKLKSDSITIEVPGLELKTPGSDIQLTATVPWSVLEDQSQGTLEATLNASLAKTDLFAVVPGLPADFKRAFPTQSVSVTARAKGNLEAIDLPELSVELPGAIRLNASGTAGNVLDSIRRSADITFAAQTYNMNFITAYLPKEQRERFRIPSGIRLNGNARLMNQAIQATLNLTEGEGKISADAGYHMATQAYKADLKIDGLEPIHFMPQDSIMWVTATVNAEGKGTDIYSPATWTTVKAVIDSVQYVDASLSNVTLDASLKENQAHVELNSDNTYADLNMTVDGTLAREEIDGIIVIDANNIDLYGLHLMDSTFTTSFQLFAEVKSDLKERNQVDATVGNWSIRTPQLSFNPKILTLKARSDEDTTQVSLHTGDLGVVLTGNAGLNRMIDQFTGIAKEAQLQLQRDTTIDIAALRPLFPDMSLSVTAGRDNPVYNLLRRSYISFTGINIQAETSPEEGILLDAGIFALARDTFLIDTVRATIRPDSAGVLFSADVIKKKYRRQPPFTAHAKGALKRNSAEVELLYTNDRNETGLLLGVRAQKEAAGYNFQLYPDKPVIGFIPFDLNPDNYLKYKSLKDIEANIRLTGNQYASLWFHSIDNGDGYPELHVELNQLNLDTITTGFAQLPKMEGILNADIQYAPTAETFMVVLDANVDTLVYQNGRVGEIMLNAVYLPLQNMEHQVDVHFYHDREEVATATALYQAAQATNNLNGSVDLMTLPLNMVTPFIPDGMAELNGALNGNVSIAGSTATPQLNGYIQMDTSSVYLAMADTRLRLDDKRIEVKNSLISFNQYNIYSVGDNPFIIDGNINMANPARMIADLKLNADNMQLLNAQKTKESLVYGKLFMNLAATLKGPVNGLTIRGDAQLLGGTDVTYLMYESALTVRDRMEGLVTFTSFADTLTIERRNQQQQLALGGIDMLMVLHIDPTVQARVGLTPDESNYVEVEGGGDLSFQYTPQGDMVMNGRYTFSQGVVKYALPVVPLKEFNIHPDSYVQWDGELMNPLINVIATERMRATVTRDGNQRRANFDVGISVQDRLDNMQLTFIIDAVDDTQSKTELAALGEDERTRWAVYMMVTGSYLGSESNGSNVNVDAVLSNFLMGEINNIAGDALKGVDINIGLDTYETEGNTQRDLTFSFAKRFYNDRIRVSVGGKVATNGESQHAESFLDNFAAEYLLDAAGTKTIKVFYDRNYESLLEGEIIETGVGFVLRRKVLHLRDLFDFRKKKVAPIIEEDAEEDNIEPVQDEDNDNTPPDETGGKESATEEQSNQQQKTENE